MSHRTGTSTPLIGAFLPTAPPSKINPTTSRVILNQIVNFINSNCCPSPPNLQNFNFLVPPLVTTATAVVQREGAEYMMLHEFFFFQDRADRSSRANRVDS
jgi:hypothetical protein